MEGDEVRELTVGIGRMEITGDAVKSSFRGEMGIKARME